MAFPFYDRKEKLAALAAFALEAQNDCSRMIFLTGRRRNGKTTLLNQVFSDRALTYLFSLLAQRKPEKAKLNLFAGAMLQYWVSTVSLMLLGH